MAKIGLEASRANREHKTGTEWYAWHLLQQFKQLDHKNDFIIYYNQTLAGNLGQAPANFYFKKLAWPWKKLWTQVRLSWELLWHKVDKFFSSNTVPFIVRGQVTATMHDLGFLRYPKLYHPLARPYHLLMHWWAAIRAQKIIAPSQATADDIRHYFPYAKNKIRVIYNGYDAQEFTPIPEAQKQEIKDKFDLPDNFLFYVGRLELKKNIPNLIRAYKLLPDKSWPLVLAGPWGKYGYNEIKSLVSDEIKDKILFLGYLSQKHYRLLLAAADLFVFPSEFEGFGIPVLEAMACGTPVICSDLPVLREVAGEAAAYFDPGSPEAMARQLAEIISRPDLRQNFSTLGLQRVKDFSWAKCAAETLKYILE
ncbi:MAG: glycosyltransferase family 1 protein [Patescibacteria group bacterium]